MGSHVTQVTPSLGTAYRLELTVINLFVSDIAVFVLKKDVKLQPTNQPTIYD